jgi:hypothetical protein
MKTYDTKVMRYDFRGKREQNCRGFADFLLENINPTCDFTDDFREIGMF